MIIFKIIRNLIIEKLIKRYDEKSFALKKLDKKLALYIDFKDGFFIEVGANNGILAEQHIIFRAF